MSRSSINFRIQSVSNVDPSNRFNSSISLRFSYELDEDPDFIPIIVHEDVVDLIEVVRLL